jgi:hypothetical protein
MSTHRCEAHTHLNKWTPYQCSRRGIVESDGKWYCKQHDPVARAERRAKAEAASADKWEAYRARKTLANCAPDLYEALIKARSFLHDAGCLAALVDVDGQTIGAVIDAALAKAKGESE